ncbi:MAG: M14 metallopeptidase family protein [Bryobacteraceae bacterium]
MRLAAALLAAAWALAAAPPTPEAFFGHRMGADRTVLDWSKVVSYFHELQRGSDRIRVSELGKSTEGRPFIAAVISAPETLRNLDRYIDIQRRLADPRITTPAEAEKLIGAGKTVVMITCSIHATEIGAIPAAIEFTYDLLTSERPRLRTILHNTVFLLVPSLNPDGLDKVTQWYRKTLGTPYEGTAPPELYHKYVGHDNNRDWYIHSQVETQLTIAKLHNVWHPHIVYDVHQQGQSASRMFVPPWLDPFEPNIDPILVQETNMVGTAMAADLTIAGKKGVAIHSSYDFWTPGRHYQAFHGGLRILTEAASARIASPVTIRPEELGRGMGYNAGEVSWNHLEPWPGGTWRLRDIVDYELIAYESCLYQAAVHREEMLRGFYRVGQRQVARTSPWGFVIPAKQRDPGAARKLLQTLEAGMVEIERAAGGDYVIRMAQPYSGYAKALLERQRYPDLREYPGGPPRRPYDVTAHTLPLLMGVDVQPVDKPPAGRLERVSVLKQQPSASLAASDSDAWRNVNRIWKSGAPVWRNMETGEFSASAREGWKRIARPRIGLYQSWIPVMDEGWTRWLLEQFGFAYATVRNAEVIAGNLRNNYDVIVFASQSAAAIANGFRPGSMPEAYAGGLGDKGAAALREFASAGGTLVFLNRAADYGIENFGLKVKDVVRGASTREYYCPGSLLNAKLARHPLTLGMPEDAPIWNEHSPAWETGETVVARYADSGLLASGWLLGERRIAGRAALVDARLGSGHVVLFGMMPQYRAQSYQAFKMFFNSLLPL